MKEEQLKRQELFKKSPEEKALLKKLKSQWKKSQVKNEQKER